MNANFPAVGESVNRATDGQYNLHTGQIIMRARVEIKQPVIRRTKNCAEEGRRGIGGGIFG